MQDIELKDSSDFKLQIGSISLIRILSILEDMTKNSSLKIAKFSTLLSYELVGVTVTNANDESMSFAVIEGGVPRRSVKAKSDRSAVTGQSVNFSYLSFGFASVTGTNQNEINIQCAVDLFVV